MKHLPFIAASALFVAACGSAGYWGMLWTQPPARPIVAASKAPSPTPGIEAAAGLFGGAPAAAAATFQLKGVIDDGPDGVAILAAEGKPPVTVGVGQEAAPGVTVREIHRTYVMIDEGGTVKRLDLPAAANAALQIVAAASDDSVDAPGPAAPSRVPAMTVARSGGPMPLPIANPDVATTPGQAAPPGIPPEQVERMRRPGGIGPAAWGAQPHT
jgi:general secretion pathway protein C